MGEKEVEGNSEFKKNAKHAVEFIPYSVSQYTNKRSHLFLKDTHTHTRAHAAPPMNPEATRVLASARLAASAVRAALLTPLVPFHRNRGSSTRSGY